MKENQLLSILLVFLIMIILAISFAIAGFNKTNNVFTTEEQKSLKELVDNTYITSNGCLDAKCFTDNYVNPHANPHVDHVFFSTSEGVVTCQSVTTQEIDIGGTLVITPLSLSMSNILTLSSTGIVSSNLFQIDAPMNVLQTFQVGGFTTTERLALLPQDGTIVYDSTIGVLSIYQSGAWFLVSGASGIVSISSSTLAITGTNTDPIINLIPSGIIAGTYQAPTITFNTYGIATNVSASTVVLGISSSTLTIGGTVSNPTVNLTPSGIVATSYNLPTVTFNQYGIATTAVQNTLTGTTNQIDVTSFPNPIISLNSSFINTVNGKVDRSGDTMTGPLNSSFVGSASSPNFAINSSNGIFQSSANYLSFTTNGANRLDIDNTGNIFVKSLSTGVVHSDIDGLLTSSLVTNAEIETQTSLSNPDSIVTRDLSGNFAANMITLSGSTINGTDVATKNYVDTAVHLGLSVKQPVVAVSVVPITSPPSGAHTIDSIVLVNGDRALLVAQAFPNEKDNGAWVVNTSGAWTRPTDFNTGDSAAAAYFLVQMGTNYSGSSWVCSTPMAVIGTDALVFSQFSSPQSATGQNDAANDAVVFSHSIGSTLHFNSLLNDVNGYLTMTNVTNSIQFAINATSGGGGNNIVARDGSGKFSANSINLSGGLIVSAGSAGSPSIQVGPVATGLSSAAGNLQLSTAFGIGISIASVTGVVTIPNLTSIGIVHNSASGVLSTSLIVDADVDPSAAIVDTKLATIATTGKVSNTATTASSSLGGNTIVLRDGSNNFAAGTITATLTGAASLNVLKSGDTMTGNLILPNGSFSVPSLQVGSSTVGLSASAGILQLSTAFGTGLSIASATGIVTLPSLLTIGIVHNTAAGLLSTSLIVNADISASAAIVDTKLATIATTGKVSNTATSASAAVGTNTIVLRDGSGNFATGGIITSNNLISKTLDTAAAGDLALGGTTATTVTIGRTASVTTVLGNFVCPVPHGSAVVNNAIGLALTAGVYTDLAGSITFGPLVQINSSSILQYTGTRTRTFRISCMITYTAPAAGVTLSFGIGVNSTIGNAFIFQTTNASNTGLSLNACVVDFKVLSTSDQVNLLIRSSANINLAQIFATLTMEAILD
jgi:hypothetical protein